MLRRDALRLIGLSALAPAAGRLSVADAWAHTPPAQNPDVEILLRAAPDQLALLRGQPTNVWRFTGRVVRGPSDVLQQASSSYLGPTIRVRRGQRVRVRFENGLSEESIVHWHGLDVPQQADGHPRLVVGPGREYRYDFTVTNRAGTYWYHPHPHMRTGPQVYMGLAGLFIVEDDEEGALGLPEAQSELLCVIQDRKFDEANQLVYPDTSEMGQMGAGRRGMGMGRGRGMGGMMAMLELENGVLGDHVLVNGQPEYTAEVEAGWVRLRLLNGSNARIYRLAWHDKRPMTVIGNDGGLLERPLTRTALTLAPAQRADLLVDVSDLREGGRLRLLSLPFPTDEAGHVGMMMGDASSLPQGTQMEVMTLRARGRNTRHVQLPDRLTSYDASWQVAPAAPVRRVPLTFTQMQWLIDGRTFEMTDVAEVERVKAGSTHVWELVNTTNPMGMQMAHPIHLHGRQFRVLSRSGGSPVSELRPAIVDGGWTDTVLVLPGETVRVQVTFSDHRGLFLYHCHILEHEDMGMMRNFRIE
ncbi:MAG TPA: multicopper oxidase domain-containing protein [Vicinamibacterales bacterium]|nr:multicopper oxidase domain-containing protein [Vicinamibacterales bacterium]